MRKRLLSMVLALCLTAALFAGMSPAASAAGDQVTGYLVSYTVQAGDTIYGLCQKRGIDFEDNYALIAKVNNIPNLNNIKAGRKIWLPSKTPASGEAYYTLVSHTLAKGETPAAVCQSYGIDYSASQNMLAGLNPSLTSLRSGDEIILPLYVSSAAVAKDKLEYYLAQHVLRSGETVSGVCADLGVDYKTVDKTIRRLNDIEDYTKIKPGKTLLIPIDWVPASGSYYKVMRHTIVSGDTVYDLCRGYGINYYTYKSLIQKVNDRTNLDTFHPGETVLIPVYVDVPVDQENSLPAPKNLKLTNDGDGVKITWSKVTGAARYRVYYKTDGGSWKTLVNTSAASYTWKGAKSGTTYTFRVRCVNSDATHVTSGYDADKSITYIAAPVYTVSKTAAGINISWTGVKGAYLYRVYCKTNGGSWKTLTNTAATSYTWTGAKDGTTYTFRVRCVNSDATTVTSGYITDRSIACIAAPTNLTVSSTASGIKATWGKVSGAVKYRVFYKPAGGSWTKAGDTAATSYTWAGAKSGTAYQIRVRCISADGKTGESDFSASRSITYLAAPRITVNSETNGIKISWSAVPGAENYRVYCKTGGGSWKTLTHTTAVSYTWTGAKNGVTYTFRVRCADRTATAVTSGYTADQTITHRPPTQVAAPQLTSVSNEETGIKATWGKVPGAVKYRVFYKPAGGSWTKAGDTTATSYTWTGAKSGATYQIRVRCISTDGRTGLSDFSPAQTITFIAAPKNIAVSNEASGVKISWDKVTGAAKYRIYYKVGGSWKTLVNTDKTSYTWTGAKNGATYTFRVRCVNSDATYVTSGHTADKTITYNR